MDLLKLRFPEATRIDDPAAKIAVVLYHYGRRWPEGYFPERSERIGYEGESLWQHAEEYLARIDAAGLDPKSAWGRHLFGRIQLFSSHVVPSLPQVASAARRLVGAECCAFVDDADLSWEEWQPFQRWAKQRGKNDTIITFNYDRVLERLSESTQYVMVEVPGGDHNLASDARCARVLKLHGSVDWKREGPRKFSVQVGKPSFVVGAEDHELAIATPGPGKLSLSNELDDLWKLAEKALSEAERVVLLGYRFPETDVKSLDRLLRGMSRGSSFVEIILGPDHASAERLTMLLPRAHHQRFFTQDFLVKETVD